MPAELTRGADGGALASLVLSAVKGSTNKEAVFETARDVTPRIEVKISAPKKGDKLGKFWVWVDRATIDKPSACSPGERPDASADVPDGERWLKSGNVQLNQRVALPS